MGVTAGLYFGAQHALQYTPDFYARALAVPAPDQQQAGQEFERHVLTLHNDIQEHDQWRQVFTARQINGWLAAELPKKFPDLLPPAISQPRIALSPGRLKLAFRYDDGQLSTIINLSLDVRVAETHNTLAVRIRDAHAGWVPLPLADFLDQISQTARHADLMLRWVQQAGDPVALVTIPSQNGRKKSRQFVLENVEIGEGELAISGRMDDASAQNAGGETEQ